MEILLFCCKRFCTVLSGYDWRGLEKLCHYCLLVSSRVNPRKLTANQFYIKACFSKKIISLHKNPPSNAMSMGTV